MAPESGFFEFGNFFRCEAAEGKVVLENSETVFGEDFAISLTRKRVHTTTAKAVEPVGKKGGSLVELRIGEFGFANSIYDSVFGAFALHEIK